MKKIYTVLLPVFAMALIFSTQMTAQETLVSVKVEKDGKVVKDTTYSFEDEEQAEHALMMMDMMGSDDEHMMKVHKSMSETHGGHSNTMVFVSEDGKTTEIKKMDGDSLVWISEGEHDHDHDMEHGKNVKIIKYKIDGDEGDVKKVVLVKSADGETIDILIDEEFEDKDEDGNVVKTKEVRVIVSEDEDGEWTVTEETEVKKKSKKQ